MPGYVDLHWSGAPPAMTAALTALGHPDFATQSTVRDARVAAFGPVAVEDVGGRNVMIALIRTPAGVTIAPPEGVFAGGGRVVAGAVGQFFEAAAEIAPLDTIDNTFAGGPTWLS